MARVNGLIKEEIINNIISMIIKGTLNEGDFLPSIRSMSSHYKISRGTVLVIYKHLESMGYIQGYERSGYIVVKSATNSIADSSIPPLFPSSVVITDSVDSTQQKLSKLQHRKPCKLPPHFIKRWASNYDNFSRNLSSMKTGHLQRFLQLSRGITLEERSLLLLPGYQEALVLIALFLQKRSNKNILLVEDPCSPKTIELFTQLKFEIIPVPTDSQGLCIDALPDITDATLLCMPTLHYPTATRLSETRKSYLYSWAAKNRNLIIEDDSYSMLGFGKNISPPLFLHQEHVTIIYLTQLTEMLGDTYNLAIVALPPELEDTFKRLNQALCSHYPPASFSMIESFLSSSYLMKYLTSLIEERQAKIDIAKIICTEYLLTENVNLHEESGFCSFTAKKSTISSELINSVFFPIKRMTPLQDEHEMFLFPHALLTLPELEKIRSQLTIPLAMAHTKNDNKQKKSPHY